VLPAASAGGIGAVVVPVLRAVTGRVLVVGPQAVTAKAATAAVARTSTRADVPEVKADMWVWCSGMGGDSYSVIDGLVRPRTGWCWD